MTDAFYRVAFKIIKAYHQFGIMIRNLKQVTEFPVDCFLRIETPCCLDV